MSSFSLLPIRWLCSSGIAAGILLVQSPSVMGQQLDRPEQPLVHYQLPAPSAPDRERLERAASWLVNRIATGPLQRADAADLQSEVISVIAWKDPTLHPQDPGGLAGYLITDTLWAEVALRGLRPTQSEALRRTLETLEAQTNGLQEVLFGPIPQIHHRPAGEDPVHGVSIGRMLLNQQEWVDVRMFPMEHDDGFTRGHPRLFAEHTAYQALYEYWRQQRELAKARLREIFAMEEQRPTDLRVLWDHDRQVLIDDGNFTEWKNFPDANRCSQYPIKLGTVLYAMRLTTLDREFPEAAAMMQSRLWQAQLPDGGVAHRITVNRDGEVLSRSGATGEATALTILARTVQPR